MIEIAGGIVLAVVVIAVVVVTVRNLWGVFFGSGPSDDGS